MAASGTARRMASSAPARSQWGKESDSRRASVARFWLRPRTTICLVWASEALVVIAVVFHGVAPEGAGVVGGIPEGIQLPGRGLDVGAEIHAAGVVPVSGPRGQPGAVGLEMAFGADGVARAGPRRIDVPAGGRVATDTREVEPMQAEVSVADGILGSCRERRLAVAEVAEIEVVCDVAFARGFQVAVPVICNE